MRPYRRFKRQRGPAAEVQSAIWLIGLGLLFLTGWWWPGIMIVIGASMVAGALVRGWEDGNPPAEAAPAPPPMPTFAPHPPPPPAPVILQPAPEPAPAPRPVRLPDICPNCGAPPRSLTSRSEVPGACPFCGSEIGE
jgi:hypothetical protein